MKKPYESSTVLLGVLEIAIGVGGLLATFFGVGEYNPQSITLLITGALMIWRRFLTSEPIAF